MISNLKEFTRLWIELDTAIENNLESRPHAVGIADSIRDRSDPIWQRLTPAEVAAFTAWVKVVEEGS